MSDSVRPHRRQPTRLLCPWDSPGKDTGVGCHFLLQCVKVKSESEVAQSCPTPSDPMDCSLPGSSVHGIFQARVLEWGAITFSPPSTIGSQHSKRVPSFSAFYISTDLLQNITFFLIFYLRIFEHSCRVLGLKERYKDSDLLKVRPRWPSPTLLPGAS